MQIRRAFQIVINAVAESKQDCNIKELEMKGTELLSDSMVRVASKGMFFLDT